jgi:hypothetical protein
MTETTNPIVQAVHDAIEAAIAATATELSQAVGFVGPATADQVRDRVEQLKHTIRQYLHWTNAAIPVLNAACVARHDPAQLPALLAAVDRYHARPAQPAPRPPYVLPVPSPWLNAIDEAIAALDSGGDRYGEAVAGLEILRAELTGEGAPELDAVWPAWPDTNEQLWASLLAQAEAEPDLVTRDDEPGDVEREIVPEQSLEIEVLIEIDAHGLLTCTPPAGVCVRVFDYACQDGAETMLFTSAGEAERQPLPPETPTNLLPGVLRALVLCTGDGDDHPLGCLIVPGALSSDRVFFDTLDRLAARYGQTLLDRSVDNADSLRVAEDWLRQMNGSW